MEKKIVFKKPKMIRRFGSALIDLILSVILAFLLSFITTPILNKVYQIDSLQNKINDYLVETKLYFYDENNNLDVIYSIAIADENLTYFYKDCIDKYEVYKETKKESGLFALVNDDYLMPENVDFNNQETRYNYQNFFDTVIENTIYTYLDDYLTLNEDYVLANKRVDTVYNLNIFICSLFGFIISFIVFPLIFKNKTLGKLFFHLKVISIASIETEPSKLQIAFRGMITVLFEYVLCITTVILFKMIIPITLIISIVLMLMSKYNQSLHDVCCQTFLVDDFYNNENLNVSEKYVVTYYNVKE